MPKPFVIYRSSAGSGKTYTLTKEYLKLAFREPSYFKYILAVTFTNKATKEMKIRILSVLEELTKGDHPLTSELMEAAGLTREQVPERASQILSSILHNYSYFSVSTIDSFFQRVIRAFAREMGLQGGFRIELDEVQVLNDVIDKVLLEVGHNQNLTDWLIKFAETRVEDGKPWDTRREIGNLAKEIFKEQFKIFEPQVLAISKDKEFIPGFLAALKKVKTTFEGTLKGIGQEALAIIKTHNLAVTDFAYKESGPAGYLEKISNGKINEPGARALSSSLDVSKWFSKTNPLRETIKIAAEDGLIQLLQQAVEYYRVNKVPYESAMEVLRHLYTYAILSDLTGKLREYRDENDMMLISDAAVFLKQIISDTETPFIYEKVGSKFKHYLIDEFQDTSGFQWDNFRPLVENSLAENNFNLVVGDVKQSIYRWRGGDLDLLLEGIHKDIGEDQTEIKDLTQNWRSRQNIVDFNNSIFKFGSRILGEQVETKLSEVEDEEVKGQLLSKANKVNVAYGEVVQDCAREFASEEGGLLKFRFYPFIDQEGVEWKENSVEQLPSMIEELEDNKYAPRDISILVRTRAEGRLVVDHLLQYQSTSAKSGYSYDVISSESLYLENSSLTRFLIACLRYLYKPDDNIQRVQMAYEYHQYIKPGSESLIDLFSGATGNEEDFKKLFNAEFFDRLTDLRKKSIYELIENLIRTFELDQFKEERAYLQGFLDAVLDFTRTENDDILSFLTWWEVIGRERTVMVSEEQNAIRVMTIHKAKGLQFKAVLMPFCEWNMDGLQGFDSILWSHSDEMSPFKEAPYLPLNYSNKLKSTVYYREYYEELIKSYLDNLNLLYVAFTRAEEVLMACCPQHSTKGEIKVSSGILDQYFESEYKLGNFNTKLDEGYQEFELGSYPSLGVDEIAKHEVGTISLENFPGYEWEGRLTIKRQMSKDIIEEAVVSPGIVIEILRSLSSIEDLNKTVTTKLNEGIAHQDQRDDILKVINQLMDVEKVGSWFNPANELAMDAIVLMPDGEDHIVDRIIYGQDSIDLINYVDDNPGEDELAQMSQIKEYFLLSNKKVQGCFLNVKDQMVQSS